jgi:hypothetical protein
MCIRHKDFEQNIIQNKLEKINRLVMENANLVEKLTESDTLRKKFMEKN